MTIGVSIPEPNKDTIFLSVSEAKKLARLDEYNNYHVLNIMSVGFIGSNMSEASFDEMLHDACRIEVAGENAMRLEHGIAVIDCRNECVFVQHDLNAMEEFLDEANKEG